MSFFDPANQVTIDRLIGSNANEVDGEEENAQATMANVEEMIEGYEWASEDIIGRKTARGAAEMIEARLLDELMALEKVGGNHSFQRTHIQVTLQANIHSFLESDDRIGIVLKYMDEAITELDSMGSLIQSYKIHLNVRSGVSTISCSLLRFIHRRSATTSLISNLRIGVFKSRHKTNMPFWLS